MKSGSLDKDPRELLNECIYLEDSFVRLFGLKIYGAPWQPRFGNWAFNVDRGENILEKWNMIPDDTDILISKQTIFLFKSQRNNFRVRYSNLNLFFIALKKVNLIKFSFFNTLKQRMTYKYKYF